MSDGKLVAVITKRTFVYVKTIPAADQVLSVSFEQRFSRRGCMMTGTVTLVPVSDTTLTSRPVRIDFAGGSPSVTVDCIMDGTATFDVPPNEISGTATPTGSSNALGTGPAGDPFPFQVTTAPGVPAAETVQSVTFA